MWNVLHTILEEGVHGLAFAYAFRLANRLEEGDAHGNAKQVAADQTGDLHLI